MLALICLGVVCAMTPWFSATAILPERRAAWGMSPALSAILTIAVQAGFVAGALGMDPVNLAGVVVPIRLMPIGAAPAALLAGLLAAADSAKTALACRRGFGACLSARDEADG